MDLDQNLMQFVVMVLGASAFILIMFLPALLELKKPKDAGPRRIMDEIVAGQRPGTIGSMEADIQVDQSIIRKVSEIISALPNLEG